MVSIVEKSKLMNLDEIVKEFQNVFAPISKPSEVMERIKDAQAQVFPLRGQEMIMVIGEKGAGKSTFINYMAGRTQVKKVSKGKSVIETYDPIAAVSHNKAACTMYPQVYSFGIPPMNLCDCPGFKDNRSVPIEIANVASLVQMAKTSKKIRCLILCIDYSGARSERGEPLEKNIKTALDFLGNPKLINSMFILFTQAKIDKEISLKEVIEGMVEEVREAQKLNHETTKHPFERLVDLGNVGFYFPVGDERVGESFAYNREKMKQKIRSFAGIDNPKDSFKITLSQRANQDIVYCLNAGQEEILEHIKTRNGDAFKFFETIASINDLVELVGSNLQIRDAYDKFERLLSITLEGLAYKDDALEYLKSLFEVIPESSQLRGQIEEILGMLKARLAREKALEEAQKKIVEERARNEADAAAFKISQEEADKKRKELQDQENKIKLEQKKFEDEKKLAESREEKSRNRWRTAYKSAGLFIGAVLRGFVEGLPITARL